MNLKQEAEQFMHFIPFDAKITCIPHYLQFKKFCVSLFWSDDTSRNVTNSNRHIKMCFSLLNQLKPAFYNDSWLYIFVLDKGNPPYHEYPSTIEFLISDLMSIFNYCSKCCFRILNSSKHTKNFISNILQFPAIKHVTELELDYHYNRNDFVECEFYEVRALEFKKCVKLFRNYK